MAETFGARLCRLRTEAGITQRALSREAGIAETYVQAMEAGRRWPSETTLRALAHSLGVSPLYLELGREGYCPHCLRP